MKKFVLFTSLLIALLAIAYLLGRPTENAEVWYIPDFEDNSIVLRPSDESDPIEALAYTGDRALGRMDLSPNGRYLVFTESSGYDSDVSLIDLQENTISPIFHQDSWVSYSYAAWASDSSKVAIVHDIAGLWIYQISTQTTQYIDLTEYGYYIYPSGFDWSPDGTKLALIVDVGAIGPTTILILDPVTLEMTEIIDNDPKINMVYWTNDNRIALWHFTEEEIPNAPVPEFYLVHDYVSVMNLDGTGLTTLYQYDFVAWPPVFVSSSLSPDGRYLIYSRDNPGGQYNAFQTEVCATYNPPLHNFLNDHRWLDESICRLRPTTYTFFVKDLITGKTSSLVTLEDGSPTYHWSPDGSQFGFIYRDKIYVFDLP